jgi:hypothetical protein
LIYFHLFFTDIPSELLIVKRLDWFQFLATTVIRLDLGNSFKRAPEFESGGPPATTEMNISPPKRFKSKMAAKWKESRASAADGSKVYDGAEYIFSF